MMKKVLLVIVSLLNLNCQPSYRDMKVGKVVQHQRINSLASDSSIVPIEEHSLRLEMEDLVDEQSLEESFVDDRLSVVSHASSLIKSEKEKSKDDREEVCEVVVPPNTPVRLDILLKEKQQSNIDVDQQKELFGCREVVIGALSALVGCGLIVVPHTIINCPGDNCIWKMPLWF